MFIIFDILFAYYNYSNIIFRLKLNINNSNTKNVLYNTKIDDNYHINKTTTSESNVQPFPIDLVYTWADSTDKKWLEQYAKYRKKEHLYIKSSNFASRYDSFEELRYSLRTVEKFLLPIINKIYIVTANQIPSWINQDLPIIQFVSHSDIFPNYCTYTRKNESSGSKHHEKCLPTFNSNAIDFSLINIPNLSEHFIYCNDDMYFGNYVNWTDFFDDIGRPKFISKDKDWSNVRSEARLYRSNELNNEQGGKQFMAMVANTVTSFMDKFGLKEAVEAEFSHIPFPMTKSLFSEVVSEFQKNVDKTIQSRFRHFSNYQMETLMIQYGIYKEKAVKIKRSSRNCRFFVTDNELGFYNLVAYAKKKPKMFCINSDSSMYMDKIQGFLDNLVGKKSIFEKEDLIRPVKAEDKKFWFLNETRQRYQYLKEKNPQTGQRRSRQTQRRRKH